MAKRKPGAMIIVDVQNDFFSDAKMAKEKNRLVKKINELTQICRSNNIHIIWVRQEFKKDLSDAYLGVRKNKIRITIEGEPGSELLPKLKVENSDNHVIKKRYSAFFNTGLLELLKRKKVETLIIAGTKTHSCVRMTAVDAYQNDYNVIIATDCLANVGDTHDDITIKFLSKHMAITMTNKEIVKLITCHEKKNRAGR